MTPTSWTPGLEPIIFLTMNIQREHWTLPHSNAACHQLMLLTGGKNSCMHMRVQGHLMQVHLIEIPQVSQKKKVRYFTNRVVLIEKIGPFLVIEKFSPLVWFTWVWLLPILKSKANGRKSIGQSLLIHSSVFLCMYRLFYGIWELELSCTALFIFISVLGTCLYNFTVKNSVQMNFLQLFKIL